MAVEIGELVGGGAFGEVFSVTRDGDPRPFAMKRLQDVLWFNGPIYIRSATVP